MTNKMNKNKVETQSLMFEEIQKGSWIFEENF